MEEKRKKNLIQYWLQSSKKDLQSAEEIIAMTSRYTGGLFFLHLSLEKILKAFFVKKHGDFAPLIHSLLVLIGKNELNPSDEQRVSLSEINTFNLETRYPEETFELEKKATKNYSVSFLQKGKELYQWIESELLKLP